MTNPIPKPRRPEPLPYIMLSQRSVRENRWEDSDRAGEEKLREIQDWAEEALAGLFIAQDMGGGYDDPQFVARINDLYDTIRNALTRQDLILGFTLNVRDRAQERAKEQLKEFNEELNRLTGGPNI